MSPIRLMMKPPSELPPSSWLSLFLSRRRRRCCEWSSRSSSRAGNSFSTVCSSSCTSFCRPLLKTSDMMRSVRMWCISVCISSEGHAGKRRLNPSGKLCRVTRCTIDDVLSLRQVLVQLLQVGRLSLQLLWTEALQSEREREKKSMRRDCSEHGESIAA
ncbi:hypothetical protein EYF80_019659 [Liparis tanakae]|uniref:Uncharacterized protein n=1 Tax=Liparis tanakae TaxID=230148 RepID=A0A4Z2HWV0_9TELE|nr:hypothetical protein EYF80_019659 [Liparis tanakae]